LKQQLATDIDAFCSPLRQRIVEMSADSARLEEIARAGAEKARDSARETLREVRRLIGFRS